MKERLQKIISEYGITSRRKAEELIRNGRISVNGRIASLGDSADPAEDEILLDGEKLERSDNEKVYILLNKPLGVVTTMEDERGRSTVKDLTSDVGVRVYPVGRLDINSSGLLIMTNDGDMTNRLTHPSHEVDKEYMVRVKGDVDSAVPVLSSALEIDGYRIRPAKVKLMRRATDSTVISVVIHEGRNRQVRRMCAMAELDVVSLVRVRIGKIHLGALKPGEWRYLTEDEIQYLKQLK